MLPVRIGPAALADLADAWAWYDDKRAGLGDEFRDRVDAALVEVARDPLVWPRIHGEIRRHMVRRFPYAVFYLAEPAHIEVLAVFHFSREPKRWKRRLL
jgi:toxin ParE1/3/4